VEGEGTDISSTPSSGDVDMLEGQDQEPVSGSGTHLDEILPQEPFNETSRHRSFEVPRSCQEMIVEDMSRSDSGGSGEDGLMCSCRNPCSDLNNCN
jgi:hypothetical protein